MEKHRGKYPVVFLNMKEIGGENSQDMLRELWVHFRRVLLRLTIVLPERHITYLGANCLDHQIQPNEQVATLFLKGLTECLYEERKEQVIVLIDECEAPLNYAF